MPTFPSKPHQRDIVKMGRFAAVAVCGILLRAFGLGKSVMPGWKRGG